MEHVSFSLRQVVTVVKPHPDLQKVMETLATARHGRKYVDGRTGRNIMALRARKEHLESMVGSSLPIGRILKEGYVLDGDTSKDRYPADCLIPADD